MESQTVPVIEFPPVTLCAESPKLINARGVIVTLCAAELELYVAVTLTVSCDAAVEEVEILGDIRGSAPYKRELLRVYVARALRQALGRSA